MEERMQKNSWLRKIRTLAVVGVVAVAGAGSAWGADYTINLKGSSRQDVPTKVDTIYIPAGKTHDLFIPELRINDGATVQYRWFVNWYRVDGDDNIIGLQNIKSVNYEITANSLTEGGNATEGVHKAALKEANYSNSTSLFWYYKLYNHDTNLTSTATGASTVTYTMPSGIDKNYEDYIICDVSQYIDGLESGGNTLTEPTLSKRYKYVIKSAEVIADRFAKGYIEQYEIDAPINRDGISVQMKSLPDNYCWYANGNSGTILVGDKFVYELDDVKYDIGKEQIISVGSISAKTEIEVLCYSGSNSKTVAKYTINVQDDAGFLLAGDDGKITSDNPKRNPAAYGELYEPVPIGKVDFDIDGVVTFLRKENNILTKSLDPDLTTYGFVHREINTLNYRLTPLQNHYGLYRSAYHDPDIDEENRVSTNDINQPWLYSDVNGNKANKKYLWIYAMHEDYGIKKPIYDRTYYDTGKYGSFYYVDAANDPGLIVQVPITGVVCGYTELVVNAWVADLTRANLDHQSPDGKELWLRPLPPNINLILKGIDKDNKVEVLHRFTSGDAITQYTEEDEKTTTNHNTALAKWQQLCYTITLRQEDMEKYQAENGGRIVLEVQNNTKHADGADYAVDDIRIYKSKPNIKVNRENNCDASTLIVGTDYATILRNMGWTAGEYVAHDDEYYEDLDYRKYRYGLMGEAQQEAGQDAEKRNSRVGNVYFAFLSKDKKTWMTINNAATGLSVNAAKSLRVAVPTKLNEASDPVYEFYTTKKDQALKNERKMNIRAVENYNKDYERWEKEKGHSGGEIDIEGIGDPEIATGENAFNEAKYQEAIVELFAKRLNIPRLRCPWYEDRILKLAIIDVDNTDLKYRGEVLDDKGTTAEGVYWVVTFSAEQVAKSGGNIEDETTIVKDGVCTLMSEFTVEPATTVLIDAVSPGAPGYTVCMETMHQITAYLNFYDKETGDAIEDNDPAIAKLDYIFDWYLGSMGDKDEEGSYKWITETNGFSIKNALDAYRKSNNDALGDISDTDLENWDLSNVPADLGWTQEQLTKMKALLMQLLADKKLLLGTPANEPFDMPINTERMVAMPYLPKTTVENIDYDFCSTETEVNLEAVAPDNPKIYQGFLKVEYNDYADVALRLGQPNMDETELKLPIYKVMGMADEATHLGLALDREEGITSIGITLDVPGYPTVGKATELNIPKQQDGELSTQATLEFSLNATAKANMKEGQFYTLLIPFVQFKGETQLNSECDGVLHLPIKVVPEYLTWRGAATDKWYDDDKWYQSTKGELHLGEPVAQDANGSDIVTNAFSPLYFSNITILGDTLSAENRELQLDNTITKDDNQEGTLSITDNIKYDLAVADKDGKITPYYIYNVDEIYFKPGATLLNQHLLTYTKAHVEFTMKEGKPYWMASPLQDVYAGDMYAPTKGGKQRTPVFGEDGKITYNEQLNDRWNPAFYQKAWNKAVWYMDKNNAEVKAPLVESNWNIEYNDVWVPYEIGKGFYARVEKQPVLVRLPKDDEDYKYYATKALSEKPQERPKAGQLAELNEADGSMTLDLSSVDNDGDHFLIGNPYMAYLNVGEFLDANTTVLAKKYWTIDEGTVRVGTPDVAWGEGANSGYVAPMQAFFVEHKDYKPDAGTTKADETATTLEVTFNAGMTVSATEVTTSDDTKSFSAVNPILTLTATSKQGQSRAAVVQKSDASNQYEADKDAVALLDSEIDAPMAYTVAGSYAAAVNAVHDYKNVPLGVYAKEGEEVELTIEGASQLVSPLYLYDAVTRSTTPIEGDRYTISLTGSSHGRYFLTTDEGIKAEGDIRIYSPADGQLIIASTPSDRLKQVQVYDLNGRMVESRQNVGTATCQLYVPGGIYIVRVQSEQGEAQAKLKIK